MISPLPLPHLGHLARSRWAPETKEEGPSLENQLEASRRLVVSCDIPQTVGEPLVALRRADWQAMYANITSDERDSET